MNRVIVGCVVGVACLLGSARGSAQRVVAADSPVPAVSSVRDMVLQTPVTVQLSRSSLRQALAAIAKSADVTIQYRRTTLEHVDRAVSVQADKMPLETVLDQVLKGTSLRAFVSDAGVVTVAPVVEGSRQVQGIVAGTVVNTRTKQPVANATVMIQDSIVATTGVDGTFRVAMDDGVHRVTIRAVGFVRQVREVTVREGQTASLAVALEPSASVLDEVVVTGTVVETQRKAIPTPITVITAEEIERRGITRIEQFFRGEVPGVIALDQGSKSYNPTLGAMQSSRVYVRGSSTMEAPATASPLADPNPLKTYVDGVELLDPSYLGTVDPQSIERIEIITGPQAATLYGSGAMGGVMQIFTKKGSKNSTQEIVANLRYGILQSNLSDGRTPKHAHTLSVAGGSGADFSYSTNLSYNYSGQWRPGFFSRSIGSSLGAMYNDGALTANGSISYTLGRNGTSAGDYALWHTFMRQTGEWDPNGLKAASVSSRKVGESSSYMTSLNVNYRPRPWWQHQIILGRTYTGFAMIPEAPRHLHYQDSLYSTESSSGHRATVSYNTTFTPEPLGPVAGTLTLGANGSSGMQTIISGELVTEASSSLQQPIVSQPLRSDGWGGFGQLRVGVFDQIFVTYGLRAERNPSYGSSHKLDWTPTNGLTYVTTHKNLTVKLLASYGRATRAPTEEKRREVINVITGYSIPHYVYQRANPNLTPEYSSGPQGGVELYYGGRSMISINRYRQVVSGLLQRMRVDSVERVNLSTGTVSYARTTQWQNVAKILQHGWEATGSVNMGPASIKGTYSWNDSRVMETYTGRYVAGQSFEGIPSHIGNISVSYTFHRGSLTWVTNYIGTSTQRWSEGNLNLYGWGEARLKMYNVRGQRGIDAWVLSGYTKSDLNGAYRLSSSWTATMNILNVGNGYESDVGASDPSVGRQTFLGLSFRLSRR